MAGVPPQMAQPVRWPAAGAFYILPEWDERARRHQRPQRQRAASGRDRRPQAGPALVAFFRRAVSAQKRGIASARQGGAFFPRCAPSDEPSVRYPAVPPAVLLASVRSGRAHPCADRVQPRCAAGAGRQLLRLPWTRRCEPPGQASPRRARGGARQRGVFSGQARGERTRRAHPLEGRGRDDAAARFPQKTLRARQGCARTLDRPGRRISEPLGLRTAGEGRDSRRGQRHRYARRAPSDHCRDEAVTRSGSAHAHSAFVVGSDRAAPHARGGGGVHGRRDPGCLFAIGRSVAGRSPLW